MKYKNIQSLFIFSIVAMSMVLGIGCSNVDPMPNDLDDEMDETMLDSAPTFTLDNDKGEEISLADFKGKPLVIFFFGNTCPRCISSAPKVESMIKQKFSSSAISVIGIDTWDGNQASVLNFRDRTGVSFDLLLMGSSVGSAYETTYDRLVVVNAKGELAFKGGSAASNDISKVVDLITELIK